jgi:hypothetical protein
MSAALEDAHATFRKWLGESYDLQSLDAVLATAAVERLNGDPLWMLVVSGSGNAKTETVQALDGAGALIVSTIASEGALLSATSKRERAQEATGGLLRQLEPRGLLVIKDFTTILSMPRDGRAQVLAALREVYDGKWVRNVGTDGGRSLEWAGRIGLVGAVTTVWDAAHAVIAAMGDRFVTVRTDSDLDAQLVAAHAIDNTGSEDVMRAELAAMAGRVIDRMSLEPVEISDGERAALIAAADLVTLARTAVQRDYRGDVEWAHAREAPTRFAKQLTQLVRGGIAIGLGRAEALALAIRCARDSVPPLRLAIIDDLAANPLSTTGEVRRRLDKPRTTIDQNLQILHAIGIVTVDELPAGEAGTTRIWRYSLANRVNPSALAPIDGILAEALSGGP